MTATDRSLLLTRDPDLLDDLRRLSVAAGVEPEVATSAASSRRLWAAAPLVVVGGDLADAVVSASMARRTDVLVASHAGNGDLPWRPGRTVHLFDDRGAASVEAAFGIVALVVVVGAHAWCLSLLGAELTVGEAARAAARVAARGDDTAAVQAEARRLVGDAEVVVRVEADHVVVEVSRSVMPPGALATWGAVRLRADATALVEVTP